MPYKPYLSANSLLHGFDSFLEERKLDADALLSEVGISREDLQRNGMPIPSRRISSALELAAERTDQKELGLAYAAVRSLPDAYGLIARLARTCHTFGAAFDTFIRYQHLVDQSGSWRFDLINNNAYLYRRDLLATQMETRQMTLLEIGNAYDLYRSVFGKHWQPVSVSFSFDRPEDTSGYKRFFGIPVEFNCEYSGIYFSKNVLEKTIPNRNLQNPGALLQAARNLDAAINRDIRDIVKSLISIHLSDQDFSIEKIASLLGLGARTLLRRLKEQGSTFRALVLETRMELSTSYLRNSSLSLVDISGYVGYSDASAFSRAFKDYFGVCPSEWASEHCFQQNQLRED